jgi:YggT family protein
MMRYAVVASLDTLLNILVWLIILRAIMSWVRPDPTSSGGQIFYRLYVVVFELTEPLVRPIRNVMPGGGGMGMDFSPLILLFILQFLRQIIRGLV